MSEPSKVHFHFRLNSADPNNLGAVEKDEGGKKRRYLEGIASGVRVDGHGERMTEACILSFQRQAERGDILLYEGLHGVNFVNDVGMLVKSSISPEGDWLCRFRLYDEQDSMGPGTLEAADKLWRQINGIAPYKTPSQKGFSIEGEIPDGGIISADQDGKRVMNDVTLLGVVVVSKPAYTDSVAHAVYKALGLTSPMKIRARLEKSLKERVGEEASKNTHFRTWYKLQDALEDGIFAIMTEEETERPARLGELFGQFKELAIQEIVDHPESYSLSPSGTGEDAYGQPNIRLVKLNQLLEKLRQLVPERARRN